MLAAGLAIAWLTKRQVSLPPVEVRVDASLLINQSLNSQLSVDLRPAQLQLTTANLSLVFVSH